jgi:hypothetical protein
MERDGHLLLPDLLTPDANARLIEALQKVGEFGGRWKVENRPKAELVRLRAMVEGLDPVSPSYAAEVAAVQREKAAMYAKFPHAGDHSPGVRCMPRPASPPAHHATFARLFVCPC